MNENDIRIHWTLADLHGAIRENHAEGTAEALLLRQVEHGDASPRFDILSSMEFVTLTEARIHINGWLADAIRTPPEKPEDQHSPSRHRKDASAYPDTDGDEAR